MNTFMALKILASFHSTTEKNLVPLLADGWTLRYRSLVLCEIHETGAAYLLRSALR